MAISEHSSVEERHVYTVNVVGSSPSARTIFCPRCSVSSHTSVAAEGDRSN